MPGPMQECGSDKALKAPAPDAVFAETFSAGASGLKKALLNLVNIHKKGRI